MGHPSATRCQLFTSLTWQPHTPNRQLAPCHRLNSRTSPLRGSVVFVIMLIGCGQFVNDALGYLMDLTAHFIDLFFHFLITRVAIYKMETHFNLLAINSSFPKSEAVLLLDSFICYSIHCLQSSAIFTFYRPPPF